MFSVGGSGVFYFHIIRIPMNDFLFKVTVVACKAGRCCPETKYRVLCHRFTSSYTFEEIIEMIEVFVISWFWFPVDVWFADSSLVLLRKFTVVLFDECFLHGFRIGT